MQCLSNWKKNLKCIDSFQEIFTHCKT